MYTCLQAIYVAEIKCALLHSYSLRQAYVSFIQYKNTFTENASRLTHSVYSKTDQ